LAGHEFASAGAVTVLGASPVENEAVLRRMVFVREDQSYPDLKVRQALPCLLAALTVALLAGRYATVRRLTV
jgi:ABC-type multidrug transport system ATPase subunit